MANIDVPTYVQALERYLSLFRRAESSIDGIRAELHMIRNDSMLPIYREAIDAITLQLTVAELALEACGHQVNALWTVQQAKQSITPDEPGPAETDDDDGELTAEQAKAALEEREWIRRKEREV